MAIHIYLENAPHSALFNYQGEAGINDDPQSYKRIQEAGGLRVFFRAEKLGSEVAGFPGAVSAVSTHQPTGEQNAGRNMPLSMFTDPVAVEEN